MDELVFYLVWSERGNPTIRHDHLGDAEAEAKRLAEKHIGTPFYIARVSECFISKAITEKVNLVDLNHDPNRT